MKTIFRTVAVAALLIASSCGKDSADDSAEQQQQAEQLESTPLEANVVSDNVLINGGTKMVGTPPESNGSISLDVSSTTKTAFLNEGFDVTLSSDAELTGAYIQFKSKDGIVSDSYFDVNLETNTSGKTLRRRISQEKAASGTNKNDNTMLDVDFNANVEPGEFCYEIRVYDANGNISESQEVCLTVESWGGNSDVIGKWQLVKTYADSSPNDFKTAKVDYCDDELVERDCNLDTITIEYNAKSCERIEYSEITMNSDGTFSESFKDISSSTISDVVIPQGMTMEDLSNLCMYSFEDSEALLTYEIDGNWAYISEEDRFIFIAYNYEEIYDGENYTDNYEPGEGEQYYGTGRDNGEVQLVDGKLVITSFEFNTSEYEK